MSAKVFVPVLLCGLLLVGCGGSKPAEEAEVAPPAAADVTDDGAVPSARDPGERGMDDMHRAMDREEMHKRDATPVDTKVLAVKLSKQGDTEENTIGAPTTSFAPRDTVYVEIESQGTASEYTIYAKWIGADGEELADYGIKVNEGGTKRTVISLSKPDGWAPGENRIELAINANPTVIEVFRVNP